MKVILKELSWVEVGRTTHVKIILEILHSFGGKTLIDELSLREEDKIMKFLKYFITRLMYGHYHCHPLLLSQLGEVVDDDERCERVQPRSWLVQHQYIRVTNQLEAYRDSSFLSSRNTLEKIASNQSIDASFQL